MLDQFRKFLVETNAFALAIGVVIGGAVAKLVSTLVSGIIMPLIALILPGGEWRAWRIPLGDGNGLAMGEVLGAAVDFVIIAFVVYAVVQRVFKVAPAK
ncbi:MAG: MscL family protein [Gemmatimonadales bacterium]